MKTDDELKALFAEHYDGFQETWITPRKRVMCGRRGSTDIVTVPSYTTDANAVLPWLEKWKRADRRMVRIQFYNCWRVLLLSKVDAEDPWEVVEHSAEADTFPRAAVIALLRAKGVEV